MKHPPVVRVTAGALKGRRLRYPSAGPGAARPTAARTREAVFSALGDVVRDAVFVDLYAAAGGVGIEALSRGAAFVHFVESNEATVALLEGNLATCAVEPARFRVHATDVRRFVAAGGLDDPSVRLIYADPPYDDDIESLLELLDEKAYPHVEFAVVEHRGALSPRRWRRWRVERTRRFGDTSVTYLTPTPGE